MTHLFSSMSVVLMTLLVLSAAFSQSETNVKSRRRCVTYTQTSFCGSKMHGMDMWTFDKELDKCVEKRVVACDTRKRNVFHTESECIRACVLPK